ncbi:HIT family protein [Exiguobacterium sp. SH5S4]|uniref:HIT family protein n=1 Tax=Exiguobacterium sp. SH5S4 TaxID=2510961 RepID=UPI00103DB5F8|nr:HIT family protein [Exiguobacterium sp. SH5S4]TCI26707.1 HIT family protein [Exiguobacterium sp. SH5S4]
MNCPFCEIKENKYQDDLFRVIRDQYPVSPGHSLIIPVRHAETYFDLTEGEKVKIWKLVDLVKKELETEFGTSSFNVGFNVGSVAGQTVPHCHVHIIPRFEGDMKDPRGGVRGVIPEKQKY